MFNIENYFNSLPLNIKEIYVSNKNLTYIPDLSKFTKLQKLDCSYNNLTYLPILPKTLITLFCSNNKLTCLPILPETLQSLGCSSNNLTCLPILPKTLITLFCDNNQLTSLQVLPGTLLLLYCFKNNLTCLPTLPCNLQYFDYYNNKIYEIINNHNINIAKKKINILNNFKYSYYCLRFKKQFRNWLWKKVRYNKIKDKYHPNNLISLLDQEQDENEINNLLNAW